MTDGAGQLVRTAAKGLRERNKEEKFNRIRTAAGALFEERGFEATTMRDVARLADIGQGTVFAYAPSKRDLIFLIVNDDNERMVDDALAAADVATGTLLERLLLVFGSGLEFLRAQGEMGRFLLREVTFDRVESLPPQETRFDANRRRFMAGVVKLVDAARERGEIRVDEDSQWIGRVLFAVYRAEARIWLSEPRPVMATALAALRRSLSLMIGGLTGGVDKP